MSESPSFFYYKFADQISDRLSYGENHPDREEFYRLLEDATKSGGRELWRLRKIVNFIEEDVKPAEEYPDEAITYLGLGDIEPYKGKATFRVCFGRDILSTSKCLYRGNIVFAGLRPYLNKAYLVEVDEALGSAELFVVQPREELVIPQFLLKYLLSNLTLSQNRWILTGSSYPRLDEEDFKNMWIVLPAKKEEQAAILDSIEPLEREADKKETEVNKLSEECRNTVLHELGIRIPSPTTFTPTIWHFFARWSEDLPERLDFVYHHPWMDEIRYLLSSLKTVRLEELIEPYIDYGVTASGKEEGPLPFVNIENLRPDGRLKTSNIRYIDLVDDNKLVHAQDILLSRSRLVGVCSIVTEKEEGFCFGSYILRMRARQGSKIPAAYIVGFLNSDLGQAQIRMLETGSFGKNINPRQIKDIRVVLPDATDDASRIGLKIRGKWEKLDHSEKQAEALWFNYRKKFVDLLLNVAV